jgi:hypothetical protein
LDARSAKPTTLQNKPTFYLAAAAEFDRCSDIPQFFLTCDGFDHVETLP